MNEMAEMSRLEDRIEELEVEMETLPVGYISKKNIRGKVRFYRQWTENGKIKSKYIPERDYESVANGVARRKAIKAELKKLQQRYETLSQQYKSLFQRQSSQYHTQSSQHHAQNSLYPRHEKNNPGKIESILGVKQNSLYGNRSVFMETAGMLEKEQIPLPGEISCDRNLEPDPTGNQPYELNVIRGKALEMLAYSVEGMDRRECCDGIVTYVYGRVTPRVCIVYGLRRTGKTTMLLQVINNMVESDFERTAYIKARRDQNMNMLDRDLKRLFNAGYRYIFLDEATMLSDFVDTASFLSDIYAAMGMKIVLSGTDSLGLWFAGREELYDRGYMIHTTWIPFREHARLLRTDDIDQYIHYGGTLRVGERDFDDPELKNEEVSFRDDESTRRYIDSSISSNIQHSLENYESGGHFRHLYELYAAGELTGAINRIIEDMNHRFLLEVLLRDFRSNDLALSKKNLLRERDPSLRTDVLDRVDVQEVTGRLMNILSIRNKPDQGIAITDEHVLEIMEYLKAQELVDEFPVRYLYGRSSSAGQAAGQSESCATPQSRKINDVNVLIVQPGMRYCQAQALVHSLLAEDAFREMDNIQREYVISRILDEVKGRMMEEIVQYETMRRHDKGCVFKVMFDSGGFDMVVYSRDRGTCDIYEIKHSTVRDARQTRHLKDGAKCALVEKCIGPVAGRYVIYRGPGDERPDQADADVGCGEGGVGNRAADKSGKGIAYINVNEYLCRK